MKQEVYPSIKHILLVQLQESLQLTSILLSVSLEIYFLQLLIDKLSY